jgi:purine-binding chemotaxis protein CheW
MPKPEQYFIFTLDGVRHAIPLRQVERVIRAVEITPLPGAEGAVSGLITMGGCIVMVVDTRRMLRLSSRPITPDDQFLIVRSGRRLLALVVDGAERVVDIPSARITPVEESAPHGRLPSGLIRLEEGIVMIHDLERCIANEELERLERLQEGSLTHGEQY